ncbi:YdgH/BhsA/McbA-like domain containing protein [Rahnella sp. PCH160]|uniref:YdgH/BhsA/McbA-like domain containing protein n=1 Tax=Rahnella sp. PCH160 TaxID=3447928 RepID=UPI0039FC5629
MKSNKIIIAAVLAGLFSVNAMAADLITKEEAKEKGYTSLGVVTTSNQYTAPMDAREELAKLADEKGGKYFVIIAAQEKKKISATAEVFK